MGAPGYRAHPFDPRLGGHVEACWSSEVEAGVDGSHLVLPDGCIDLLYDGRRGRLVVVGTMTRAVRVSGCGPTRFVGVRFRPGGALPFVREHADRLTDRSPSIDDVLGHPGRELEARLTDTRTTEEAARVFESFLVDRAPDTEPLDPRVARAVRRLRAEPGARVDGLAAELEVSRQHLRRLFLRHTGLSPKAFARVARLGRAVEALRAGGSLASTAAIAGYADQAHMSREVRDLAGVTPSRLG